MAFPASPSNNQVHKEGTRSFVYDSTLGVWDQVKEINRALVPNTGGSGVPLSAPSLTIDSMVMTPRATEHPDVAVEGTMYYNNADNALYISNGVSWIRVSNNFTATGGTKTTHGIYTVHSFTSGTTTWTPDRSGNVDILLVAGGGGAGGRFHAGGGGAGGVRQISLHPVTAIAYTITVGGGGNGGANANVNGGTGGNSSMSGSGFTTLTASGGGAGAGYELNGGNGGSGGGGNGGETTNNDDPGAGNVGGYSPPEGYAGVQHPTHTGYHAGGGGGGAGGVGGNTNRVADGGDGINNDWRTGSDVGYGGGGVGSTGYSSLGHTGAVPAGTHGAGAMGSAGAANTGAGGGASASSNGSGGAGGSGIVVIRHIT